MSICMTTGQCAFIAFVVFFAWGQILVTIVVENCKERERLASLYLPVPVSFVDPAGTLLGEDEFVAEVNEGGEVIQHILTLVQVYLEQHGPVRSLLHSFRKNTRIQKIKGRGLKIQKIMKNLNSK